MKLGQSTPLERYQCISKLEAPVMNIWYFQFYIDSVVQWNE